MSKSFILFHFMDLHRPAQTEARELMDCKHERGAVGCDMQEGREEGSRMVRSRAGGQRSCVSRGKSRAVGEEKGKSGGGQKLCEARYFAGKWRTVRGSTCSASQYKPPLFRWCLTCSGSMLS